LAILLATDLGLGTCWLGGTFTKSRFAERIDLEAGESLPAVAAVGHMAANSSRMDTAIRQQAHAHQRLPWQKLFFEGAWGQSLSPEAAGAFARPLEMVRLGPSASNKQPWRIVRQGAAWHFYMQRTPGYRQQTFARLLKIADMQRLDMGIAMSHFALTANELGLPGRWQDDEPAIGKPEGEIEYTVSWGP
jgi:hypothetical protein